MEQKSKATSFLMTLATDVKVTKDHKKVPDATDKTLKKVLKDRANDKVWATPDHHEIFWKDVKTQLPQIAEQIKSIFKGKEKISVADLKAHIDEFEPEDEKFWLSLREWTGMQKDIESAKQLVVQLNMDSTVMAEIKKDPVVADFFDDYVKTLGRNGSHPVHNQTLAWCRVYDMAEEYVIEEIQSDLFGASTTLRETANSSVDGILKNFTDDEKKHIENFWKKHFIDWDKKLVASVIAMARKNGKKHVWIFDEDYKLKYLTSKSKAQRFYKVVPRDLGFKRATYTHGTQKIPSWTRVVANVKEIVESKYEVAK